MKLTKKSHACVRLEKDGRTLVLDPGMFTEEDAVLGADALLVTHEHADHFDEGRLRAALDADPAGEVGWRGCGAPPGAAAGPGGGGPRRAR
ncbi:MBL fold metallo-hydrolase, partial [Streptomyces sp. NPDC059082]|uniref:MBL fold metallo-hydrolase n=1 Tax=Streptomyces sp. NPDC059082 TaxID=3346720 RepID=UPI0036C98003